MADSDPATPPTTPLPAAEPQRRHATPQRVVLVSYPKIVFMYPTFFASLIAGAYAYFRSDNPAHAGEAFVVASIFLSILAVNLMVFSFDFPRETSLILAASLIAVVLGLVLIFRTWDILPWVKEFLQRYHPQANATFYFTIGSILGVIYLFVVVSRQFDYWEVTPNELLHHYGVLSDLKRFPSPNMRVDKEINDVFENLLLGSGRLILHPANEPRAIVLENVMMINQKEAKITKMLGALKVQVAH